MPNCVVAMDAMDEVIRCRSFTRPQFLASIRNFRVSIVHRL